MRKKWWLTRLALAVAILFGNLGFTPADEAVDYLRDIKPILKSRCYACHGALKQESGLRVDTGQALRQGGDSGPAVISGKVEASPLIARVTAMEPDQRMPPEGEPLTAMQILALRQWISQGAVSLENEQPEMDPRRHWAFQQPRRAAVPAEHFLNRAANPIDAFIGVELARQGLAPPARRRETGSAAAGVSRPGWRATDGGRVAGLSCRGCAGCVRARDRTASGVAPIWRAVGPSLDGRLALQRLVWSPCGARRHEQLSDDLALA